MTPDEKALEIICEPDWHETWAYEPCDYNEKLLLKRIAKAIHDARQEAYEEAIGVLSIDGCTEEACGCRGSVVRLQAIERIRALKDSLCNHKWIDARNDVISSGEYCSKCGQLRSSLTSVASS